MTTNKLTLFYFLAVFLFFACKDDKDAMDSMAAAGNPVETVENSYTSGQTVSADFIGRITDQEGSPIAGASVSAGGSNTFTNAQGFYQLEDAAVDDNYALIKVEHNGMFDQFRALKPITGQINYVDITMINKVLNGFFSTASGGEIDIPGGPTVTFPSGELVTSSGQPYSGEVLVAGTYLDPSDSRIMSYMPGSLAAVAENGEAVGMITYGMVGVELRSVNGQGLQLAGGRKATLTMPLPETHASHAPESIPLWYFDETAGIWQEEGVANRNGNSYVGQVSHFTFWNCDVSLNTLSLEGTISFQSDGWPSSDVVVKLTRPNGSVAYTGLNAVGYFSGIVPANEILELEVLAQECDLVLYSETIGPFSDDQDLGAILIDADPMTLGIIEFQGSVVDCQGSPLSEGIILYSSPSTNSSGYVTVNDEGTWSVSIPCLTQGVIEFVAISPEDFTQSDTYEITYNLTENAALNVGEIGLCEGEMIGTYMTYNDGTNEITFTEVELIGFEPGTFTCGDLTATNPGAETTDFISGIGLGSLSSDSLNFDICLDQFQVQGYLPSGEYLVFEGQIVEANWLEVIQHTEGEEINLLEASTMMYPDFFVDDSFVTIYTDESMTTTVEEYTGQSVSLTFLVFYE